MKRLPFAILIVLFSAPLAVAEDRNPPASFGVQLGVDYNVLTGSFDLWNLRYGLGLDFLVHLGASFYLGAELGAAFGFHKVNLADPAFDRIDVQFPMHLTALVFPGSFMIQLFGGANYVGRAALTGGVLYLSNFSFYLLPDAGVKLGWGTINNLFLKGGYVFGGTGFLYFGLGARIGLF